MKLTRKNTKHEGASAKKQSAKPDLADYELVAVAAYLAGAQTRLVDTEDIAVKANALAPGRFCWRKYKDQINIEAVRKHLWYAAKPEKGGYLIGSEKAGWRLTKAGFDFARRQRRKRALRQSDKVRASQNERVAKNREVRRMMNEAAFLKHRGGDTGSITKFDAERFFRLDDYVTGKTRSAKIERFRIMAVNNEPLTRAIDFLANMVRGG
jgi:hypothetical protein